MRGMIDSIGADRLRQWLPLATLVLLIAVVGVVEPAFLEPSTLLQLAGDTEHFDAAGARTRHPESVGRGAVVAHDVPSRRVSHSAISSARVATPSFFRARARSWATVPRDRPIS